MKTWLIKSARIALILVVVVGGAVMGMTWYGNRDLPPPTLAEHQASYQRAVGWIRTHEATVLADGNSALWWMVQAAAERTHDAYLHDLVRQYLLRYAEIAKSSPWQRFINPKAEVVVDWNGVRSLAPYQRFFQHALTCFPVVLEDGSDSNDFLDKGLCRPITTQVYARDSVCTTHQLMGVTLFQRAQCPTTVNLGQLQSELVSDIHEQMRWDNVLMKDAYIQRVLMLYWVSGAEQVKPAWMHRVLAAQQADGGWVGERHLPELPDGLQLWRLRSKPLPTNFHATAQGLLLSALAISQAPH